MPCEKQINRCKKGIPFPESGLHGHGDHSLTKYCSFGQGMALGRFNIFS
jgi:hypothetical protein